MSHLPDSVTIDPQEFASDLATKRIQVELLENGSIEHEDEVYEENDGEVRFIEAAQDRFNEYYTYYMDQIEMYTFSTNQFRIKTP